MTHTKAQQMIKNLCNLKSNTYDAAIITSNINRRYFSKFKSSFGLMLFTKQKAYLLVDFRYFEAAKKNVIDCEVILFENLSKTLKQLLIENNINSIIFERENLTVKEMDTFKKILGELKVNLIFDQTLDNIINNMRVIKSEEEINNILHAQKIAQDALTYAKSIIKPGISEKELALKINFFMLEHNAEDISFDTICVSGKNSSLPHGVPTNKCLEDGDFVTIDMGAMVNGYHSDMTRTFALGNITKEQKHVYNIVLNAQLKGLSKIKPGIMCKNVDKEVRDYIYNSGYKGCFGHSTGHGVGLNIHEAPSLSLNSDTLLKTGMVVTVEPGIYIPGKFGVRIEDMVVITNEGYKNLISFSKKLEIL